MAAFQGKEQRTRSGGLWVVSSWVRGHGVCCFIVYCVFIVCASCVVMCCHALSIDGLSSVVCCVFCDERSVVVM